MAVEQLHYGHHLAQRLRGAQCGFVRDRIHEPHASFVRESVRGTSVIMITASAIGSATSVSTDPCTGASLPR